KFQALIDLGNNVARDFGLASFQLYFLEEFEGVFDRGFSKKIDIRIRTGEAFCIALELPRRCDWPMQTDRSGDRIEPGTLAIRALLALALLPTEPRLFDRIRARAALHFGQIE